MAHLSTTSHAEPRPQTRTKLQIRQSRVFATFRELLNIKDPTKIMRVIRAMGIRVWGVSQLTDGQVTVVMENVQAIGPLPV